MQTPFLPRSGRKQFLLAPTPCAARVAESSADAPASQPVLQDPCDWLPGKARIVYVPQRQSVKLLKLEAEAEPPNQPGADDWVLVLECDR